MQISKFDQTIGRGCHGPTFSGLLGKSWHSHCRSHLGIRQQMWAKVPTLTLIRLFALYVLSVRGEYPEKRLSDVRRMTVPVRGSRVDQDFEAVPMARPKVQWAWCRTLRRTTPEARRRCRTARIMPLSRATRAQSGIPPAVPTALLGGSFSVVVIPAGVPPGGSPWGRASWGPSSSTKIH